MKIVLSLILFIFCPLLCPAQKSDEKTKNAAQQNILKKQLIVDEFDIRAKDIPFAAVRVFVRTRLAEWLWKNGTDETGRAEQLAVRAVEEIYKKPDEMPESRSLKAGLFRLLEVNAKETANRLRTKYNIGSAEDLYNSASFSKAEGSDKIIAEKVKKALTNTNDLAGIQAYLMTLQAQKSPEFVPLLSEIINIQESGGNNFTTASLLWIAGNFRDSTVPVDLKIRFYKIVFNRAKNALQSDNGGEIHFADSALFRILPDIKANAPELAAEADGIKSALAVKTTPGDREYQKSELRILERTNKLDALIAEADKTDIKNKKYSLLTEASRFAKMEGKFQLAVDLLERTIEDDSINASALGFRLLVHDQLLGFLAQEALRKNDIHSAEYAAKKIVNDLKKADALQQTAFYFVRNKDVAAALDAYDEALKLILKADNDKSKIQSLLGLVSAAAAIDQSRVPEIISITAKLLTTFRRSTWKTNREPKTLKITFRRYYRRILVYISPSVI